MYLEAKSDVNFLKCFSLQLVQSRSSQRLQFDAACNMRGEGVVVGGGISSCSCFLQRCSTDTQRPTERYVSQLANSCPCYIT